MLPGLYQYSYQEIILHLLQPTGPEELDSDAREQR
jgi:hypothetical protein